ncbi:HNH endonuclease [Nostoc sp. 'Peltigera membranacea cyanobiont' 213]|uniref:HNH endonuclease n=1 Tax=unclassified Nostoc TaxID=2593658 RepID=UPI00083DF970|nr:MULTISPECIES: HNH endonuclease signature motif containing protein [unclassified Nostoc]ODH01314.1 HNH endonuclease [Nostoc sp. KVJ20]OYD87625.1 HNH endonuclease [Nostoc sp. 'Peltigera membranacea cyanobiont' 213]
MPFESERVSAAMRRTVASRAKNLCEYCRCPEEFSPDSFTIEHIKPRQAGGETIVENLAWSCYGCNGRKHTKTSHCDPETKLEVGLFHPRQQLWSEHFSWNDDFTQVIGKTSCGRATVSALQLNRVGVVNLRRLLTSAGLHPPP